MIIRHPENKDIPALKEIWRQAFNDENDFINAFFSLAFSENRALIAEIDDSVASMLYWFDFNFNDKKVAYVYAVATLKDFRKKGLCNALMTALHKHLKALGYIGASLVPTNETLFNFYGKMGYITCIYNDEDTVIAKEGNVSFNEISIEEYFTLRKKYLPENCIRQNNNEFLKYQTTFYKGEDFIFALRSDDFFVVEFFGNKEMQPYILYSQNKEKGVFRTFGKQTPFAMYLPFEESQLPEYLDFAYD